MYLWLIELFFGRRPGHGRWGRGEWYLIDRRGLRWKVERSVRSRHAS